MAKLPEAINYGPDILTLGLRVAIGLGVAGGGIYLLSIGESKLGVGCLAASAVYFVSLM